MNFLQNQHPGNHLQAICFLLNGRGNTEQIYIVEIACWAFHSGVLDRGTAENSARIRSCLACVSVPLQLGYTQGLHNTEQVNLKSDIPWSRLCPAPWLWVPTEQQPHQTGIDTPLNEQSTSPKWDMAFSIYSFKLWYLFYLYLSVCIFPLMFQDDLVKIPLHNNLLSDFASNILQFSIYLMLCQKLERKEVPVFE